LLLYFTLHQRWIGNAPFADIAVIWARNSETSQINAFIVRKGNPGFRCVQGPGEGTQGCGWDELRVAQCGAAAPAQHGVAATLLSASRPCARHVAALHPSLL
jgi:alkylation response protein AidB-like acyl-CoA dehydrogenase